MLLNGKRVSVATLGCKVNQYDTNAMLGALTESGFSVVEWGQPADVALVNTCTVTAVADSKARLLIRQAARRGIPVCVCGCLAERDPEGARQIEGVAAVVPMGDRNRIAQVVSRLVGLEAPGQTPKVLRANGPRTRTRGFLKIQEGCNNPCTYCIIPSVRGKARTRSEAEILEDARYLAAEGVRELVLSGIHISSYGMDNGANLIELLRDLSDIEGIERLRLGSVDPWILSPQTVEEFAGIKKLCPHFHVALQSGCAKTLRAMKRQYSPRQYEEKIRLVRSVFWRPAITTDVMTGFPGETDEDFLESLEFVKSIGFAKLHVFPYSEREGTPAATMPGAVPVNVRKERAALMIGAGYGSQVEYVSQFRRTVEEVLFDRDTRDGATGYTTRYTRVFARGAVAGQMAPVLLKTPDKTGYIGELYSAH